jgi:hypothetical protein
MQVALPACVDAAGSALPLELSAPAAPAARLGFLSAPLPRADLVFAFAVIALNMVDAFGTLRHLSYGATELNPLMVQLLEHGPLAFVVGKHALACAGIIGILAHIRFNAARLALRWVLFPIYVGIAAYQLFLFRVIT